MRHLPIALLFGLCLPALAHADPLQIAAQGRLTSNGGPVADGGYAMAVGFYEAETGGKPVFTESFLAIPVNGGVFSVVLGAANVQLDTALFAAGKPMWVGVTVGADPELPRAALRPVPFAVRANYAGTADSATDVQCSGCVGASDIAKGAVTSEKIAGGAVLAGHAAFNWAAADAPGGVANFAIGSNTAKIADSAKNADFADVAAKLNCTGCVLAKMVDPAALAPFAKTADLAKVATSGQYADLQGGPDLSPYAAKSADNVWTGKNTFKTGLDAGNAQVTGMRLQNAASDPVKCTPEMLGFVYFNTASKTLAICTGSEFTYLAIEPAYGSQQKPGASCKDILAKAPASKSGPFYLKTASSPAAYQAYCDMVTDGGGWTLALSNIDATKRTLLDAGVELINPSLAGSQKYVLDLLSAATEIRYADTSDVPFLEATIDGAYYATVIQQGTSHAVAVTYKKGPLAGKQRYIEANASFHWGHRHNYPTVDGKPTNVLDVYNDSCRHTCWEDVNLGDRAFAGDHCPSATTTSFCPATNPAYSFPPESTRGGSFKFRKWVR